MRTNSKINLSWLKYILLSFFFASIVNAATIKEFWSTNPLFAGDLVLQGGGYWSHMGTEQHIGIAGLIGDRFTITKEGNSNGLLGLGYFIHGKDFERVQLSYGIDAFFLSKTGVAGDVIQEDLFSNLVYHYHVTHYPVFAVIKAKIPLQQFVKAVTMDAGIGPNFMRTGGFIEYPYDGLTLPDMPFAGHTSTEFSATAGMSWQIAQLAADKSLECGYRFFYLGEGHFNRNTDQILTKFRTGSVYGNAFVCGAHI